MMLLIIGEGRDDIRESRRGADWSQGSCMFMGGGAGGSGPGTTIQLLRAAGGTQRARAPVIWAEHCQKKKILDMVETVGMERKNS